MPTQVPPSKNSLEDAIVEIQTERKQNLKVSIIYCDKWEQSQASSSQIPNFPVFISLYQYISKILSLLSLSNII